MVQTQDGHILLLVFLILCCSATRLVAASATVNVRATLLPYAGIDVQQQQSNVSISQSDLERRYVDIPFSAIINVDTNVPSLILSVMPSGREVILASVSGTRSFSDTVEIELTADERMAHRATRTLDFRVMLDEQMRPGRYALKPWISILGY